MGGYRFWCKLCNLGFSLLQAQARSFFGIVGEGLIFLIHTRPYQLDHSIKKKKKLDYSHLRWMCIKRLVGINANGSEIMISFGISCPVPGGFNGIWYRFMWVGLIIVRHSEFSLERCAQTKATAWKDHCPSNNRKKHHPF